MKPDTRIAGKRGTPNRQGFPGVIGGVCWYSPTQRRMLDAAGRERWFAKLTANHQIVEYTEMLTVEDMLDDPFARCQHDDARRLGVGFYHHSEPCQ